MTTNEKRFVYLLRSVRDGRPYVGLTCNVSQRVARHNSGGSLYTAPYRPWRLVVSLEFATESSAIAFEKYFKVGLRPCIREQAFQMTARPRASAADFSSARASDYFAPTT
jgi:putative endonuclease